MFHHCCLTADTSRPHPTPHLSLPRTAISTLNFRQPAWLARRPSVYLIDCLVGLSTLGIDLRSPQLINTVMSPLLGSHRCLHRCLQVPILAGCSRQQLPCLRAHTGYAASTGLFWPLKSQSSHCQCVLHLIS